MFELIKIVEKYRTQPIGVCTVTTTKGRNRIQCSDAVGIHCTRMKCVVKSLVTILIISMLIIPPLQKKKCGSFQVGHRSDLCSIATFKFTFRLQEKRRKTHTHTVINWNEMNHLNCQRRMPFVFALIFNLLRVAVWTFWARVCVCVCVCLCVLSKSFCE